MAKVSHTSAIKQQREEDVHLITQPNQKEASILRDAAKLGVGTRQNIQIQFLESEGLSERIYLILHESAHKQTYSEFGGC